MSDGWRSKLERTAQRIEHAADDLESGNRSLERLLRPLLWPLSLLSVLAAVFSVIGENWWAAAMSTALALFGLVTLLSRHRR
ncbi:MAG: hypothetical protein WDM91_18990 [Rhizomicrobium sp.]